MNAILNGAPLNFKETGAYANQPFELEPKQGGVALFLTFRSKGAQSDQILLAYGNWSRVSITLSG